MTRTVNYDNKAEKIKEELDELVKELYNRRVQNKVSIEKVKLADIDFESIDLVTLMHVQARVSKLILDKSRQNE